MEDIEEKIFSEEDKDVANTFLLDQFNNITMDSLSLAYTKRTLEELQAANDAIQRMKQSLKTETHILEIGQLKAQLMSSLNDIEKLEQRQIVGYTGKCSSVTGKLFPSKKSCLHRHNQVIIQKSQPLCLL